MSRKWRPTLAMVLCGALAGTLAVAFLGLVALRYAGPEIGFRNAAGLIAVVLAVLTGICGLMLVRVLLRPIRDLARYAASVQAGDGAITSPPVRFGTQELGAMAGSVIDMAEALRTRESTIRSYSDHVTHELKSPVSAIIAAAELLEDRVDPAGQPLLAQITGAAEQMNTGLDALRSVVRAREADYRGTSTLAEVVRGLAAQKPGLNLRVVRDAELPMANEGLELVLGHLLDNAAGHGATEFRLIASPLVLEVADNGTGIAEADRARVFQPFFTTRREQGGTGMGLAIVRNVLAAHGASIETTPSEAGARFEIRFGQV